MFPGADAAWSTVAVPGDTFIVVMEHAVLELAEPPQPTNHNVAMNRITVAFFMRAL